MLLGKPLSYIRRKLIGGRRIAYIKPTPNNICFLNEDVEAFLKNNRVEAASYR